MHISRKSWLFRDQTLRVWANWRWKVVRVRMMRSRRSSLTRRRNRSPGDRQTLESILRLLIVVLCLEIGRQTRLLISIGWYATQTCLFLRMGGFTPLNSHPHQAMRITFNKTLRFIQARQNSIWTNYWVLRTMALNSVNAYNLAAFTEFQAV